MYNNTSFDMTRVYNIYDPIKHNKNLIEKYRLSIHHTAHYKVKIIKCFVNKIALHQFFVLKEQKRKEATL